ncbi:MAG: rhodanese-like domain-containing protein [Chitinophagales bacterium]
MGLFSIFGIGNNKLKEGLRRGGTIIDIRIAAEFDQGKIRNSVNIPVDRININLDRIRHMRKPIILCSNSDSESEQAVSVLKANGIKETYNGGSWTRLLKMIKSL